MNSQQDFSFFDSEMLPVTVSILILKGLDKLVSVASEQTNANHALFFNLLDADLPYRGSLRHLPCLVRVLLTEHRRSSTISQLDLNRRDPALPLFDADCPYLHSKHGAASLAASINVILRWPSEAHETLLTTSECVPDLLGNSCLVHQVGFDDV
jgi:hypothetical protein